MSQSSRSSAVTGNGVPAIQPANPIPTPRTNVRRVAPAGSSQPTVSLAEHEALKRRLETTESLVCALVKGSQPRKKKSRSVDSDSNLRVGL